MGSVSPSPKVYAVTGAASGIGLATAHLLASQSHSLSISDNNEAALRTAREEILKLYPDAQILSTPLDVRDGKAVDAWIESTVSHFGKLDGCANIAGVIGRQQGNQSVWEITDEEYDFIMGVNVRGLMNCMRAETKAMLQLQEGREGADKRSGSVVNAASICGSIGMPRAAVYSASKHAVVGMTRAAAKELGERGVRVNCFNPGFIETPMLTSSIDNLGDGPKPTNVAMGRTGRPEEVAKLVAWLLGDESSYVTGACVAVDGGWNC